MRFKYIDASARNAHRPHHFVLMDSERRPETTQWCMEQFGEPAYTRDEEVTKVGRWVHHAHVKYWLRDEADAFAFRMRWC